MAKRTTRTTQSQGTVKRTRKTAPRGKTARRTAAKAVEPAAAHTEPAAAHTEPAAAHTEPTSAQIAERAYFLSLARQGPGGPLDDWLQAEQELRNGSCPA